MSPRDLEPLDASLKDLLTAERDRPDASPAERDRVLGRVHATLGLGGPRGGGAPPPAGSPGSSATGPLGGLLKPILLGTALGIAVVAAAGLRSELMPAPPPAAPSSSSSSPVIAATIEAPRPVAIEEIAPSASAAATPPPPAEASAPAGHDASLAAERLILDEAQRALAGGQSAAAFEALARHAAAFPHGRLSEEREGLWIRALISAGRLDEARERAARFRRIFPRSMLIPALEETLGTIP